MKKASSKKIPLLLIIMMTVSASLVFAQKTEIKPVLLEEPMPNFTLPVLQGGELILSSLKGKNVLLIFPRGLAGKDHWCHVCNYQYAELIELEQKEQFRKRYDMEILFVLPYGREMVKEWVEVFPDQLTDLENWRNPSDPGNLDETGKRRMKMANTYFPKNYMYEKGKVPTPFPILIDAERTVTKGLGIFTMEWSGSKIEQNIPTVLILDKTGTVQFKYMSQNTIDRPSAKYLRKFLETLNR